MGLAFASAVRATRGPDAPQLLQSRFDPSEEPSLVVRSHRGGAIQAIDATGLVRFARANECTVALVHSVGDFVPAGATVILVYGGGAGVGGGEPALRRMIALGEERTIEQDPAFALRIMVDIAIKALSPAVNDPTTAVQVLNHLGDVLRLVGETDFSPTTNIDPGRPAVFVPVRGWPEYLALGVTEIRDYGASSVQVARRLRGVLHELHGTVRPEHRAAVEDEIRRLDVQVTRELGESTDLDRALEADRQGLGGAPALDRPEPIETTIR